MAESKTNGKKAVASTIIFGLVTAVLYGVVFSCSGMVMNYFTRGGLYAALPIATVFMFSFAHGAFASNLWSVLGIEAVTKQPAKRPVANAPSPTRRHRPRVRLSV